MSYYAFWWFMLLYFLGNCSAVGWIHSDILVWCCELFLRGSGGLTVHFFMGKESWVWTSLVFRFKGDYQTKLDA